MTPSSFRDEFHFSSMDATEDMSHYAPGGYHPIIVGNILTNENGAHQYRIMHKLGFGAFSTVWLAQKSGLKNTFVAVKVTMADGDLTNEALMLKAAASVKNELGQPSHVLNLLDHFTLRGPNGTHSVLVTDVVVPIYPLLSPKRPPLWRKATAQGLVKAIAHLHAASIVHGDLHLGNVGLALPQLADQDEDDVMQDLSPYNITIVLPTSSTQQTASLPAYVTEPCNLARYYDRIALSDSPQTKIFDFGSAHKAGTLPQSFQCALQACSPEIVFARVIKNIENPPVEPAADIWALGAVIYEIVTGSTLFHGVGFPGLLPRMAAMAGTLPPEWQNWHNLPNPPEVSPSGANKWWELRRNMLRQNCTDEADTDALISLLRKMLVLDPATRLTAAEVLHDPWFSHDNN